MIIELESLVRIKLVIQNSADNISNKTANLVFVKDTIVNFRE